MLLFNCVNDIVVLFRGGSLGSGLLGLLALAALQHGVGHDGGDQLDGPDGVVVSGDHIVDFVGVAVGVSYDLLGLVQDAVLPISYYEQTVRALQIFLVL